MSPEAWAEAEEIDLEAEEVGIHASPDAWKANGFWGEIFGLPGFAED